MGFVFNTIHGVNNNSCGQKLGSGNSFSVTVSAAVPEPASLGCILLPLACHVKTQNNKNSRTEPPPSGVQPWL